MPCNSYSTGSSMVRMFLSGELISESRSRAWWSFQIQSVHTRGQSRVAFESVRKSSSVSITHTDAVEA